VDIFWKILATLGLVALNGFFVAAEFAAVSARRSRLEAMADSDFLAKISLKIKDKLDLYLSTCQLGITIASLGLGYVTEPAVAGLLEPILDYFGYHAPAGQHHLLAILIALAISTSLHVVVGEVAPKNWAILYPDRILPLIALPLVAFTYLFYPAIWLLNSASNVLLRWTGVEIHGDTHGGLPHTEDELRGLLAQAVAQGTISKGNESILTSAFEFGDLKVRQIMTPRTEVDFLLTNQPVGEILKIVQKSAFTRLPLCENDVDHVVGVVHMKDLFNHLKLVPGKLRFSDEKTETGQAIVIADGKPGSAVHVIGAGEIELNKIKREILFVPELLPVPKLLRQFQKSHIHMAVVVDEYGATQGIVTLEDVIEEIVGDIEDEFDPASATSNFVMDGENFRVSGQFPLHELRERLPMADIGETDVDTVGGFITQQLKRWPRVGDTIALGNYTARVVSQQQNRITQVLIIPSSQEAMRADGPGKA
jgi:CBS domain containing-hemolysin-like protein